jgi:hypothetical protein
VLHHGAARQRSHYFVLYFCLPVLALGLAIDLLLYFVLSDIFGRCYALFCLFA